jgi:hypothetical protein
VTHPSHADAGRREHFRAALRRPGTLTALVVLCSGALVAGAFAGSAPVALGAPVVVAALVVAVAFYWADHRAAREFWGSVAARLGFKFTFETDLLPLTPLLGAGDRRHYRHTMKGALGDTGLEVRLAHFRYDVRHEDSKGNGTWTHYPFTVCIVEIEPGMQMFPGVYVRARRGLLERANHDWLRNRQLRGVELESTAFNETYELRVTAEQDPGRLRELFDPKTVLWFAEHPLKPHIELRAGTLVVYVPGFLEDIGWIVWLLDAASRVAGRVLDEIGEAEAARAA